MQCCNPWSRAVLQVNDSIPRNIAELEDTTYFDILEQKRRRKSLVSLALSESSRLIVEIGALQITSWEVRKAIFSIRDGCLCSFSIISVVPRIRPSIGRPRHAAWLVESIAHAV